MDAIGAAEDPDAVTLDVYQRTAESLLPGFTKAGDTGQGRFSGATEARSGWQTARTQGWTCGLGENFLRPCGLSNLYSGSGFLGEARAGKRKDGPYPSAGGPQLDRRRWGNIEPTGSGDYARRPFPPWPKSRASHY